jgi:hypothetical protein
MLKIVNEAVVVVAAEVEVVAVLAWLHAQHQPFLNKSLYLYIAILLPFLLFADATIFYSIKFKKSSFVS